MKSVSETTHVAMTSRELRAVLALASVYSVRMLGLFLILPVFALYAKQLPDYTPMMVGLAIGAYGLTQALLQIPLGLLSDRIGRKPVIIGGLLIYALGSVIAACSGTLHGIIWGRVIQGSGAVAAAVMALTADLTTEEVRLRAMAMIGMSIGLMFMLSMLLGPLLEHWVGVPGIFWITGILALSAIAVVIFLVPQPEHSIIHRDAETVPAQFSLILGNAELLRVNIGIFILQMLMTALFLVVPIELRGLNIPTSHHWYVYLPVILLSMLSVVPMIIFSERKHNIRLAVLIGISIMIMAELALYIGSENLIGLTGGLFLYFVAFNLLEATLPSLVSKLAPAVAKGTAMGVYTTSQFLGAFCGGLFGGLVHQTLGLPAIFILSGMAALLWLLVATGMSNPPHLANKLVRIGNCDPSQVTQLTAKMLAIPGVLEAVIVLEEELAYLKIDKSVFNITVLDHLLTELQ